MCTNEELKVELDAVKECSEQNRRALYGKNGTAGLIADVGFVKKDVNEIKTNHLPHLKQDLEKAIAILEDKSIKWKDVLERFLIPIVVAAIIAVTNYLIIRELFQ